jgi:hypothetical protein
MRFQTSARVPRRGTGDSPEPSPPLADGIVATAHPMKARHKWSGAGEGIGESTMPIGQPVKYGIAAIVALVGIAGVAWQFATMRDPNSEHSNSGPRLGKQHDGAGNLSIKGDPSETPEQLKERVAKQLGVDPSKVRVNGTNEATVDGANMPKGARLPGLAGGAGAIQGPFEYKPLKGDAITIAKDTLQGVVDEKARGDSRIGVGANAASTAACDALLAFWRPAPAKGEEPAPGARLAAALGSILGDAEVDMSKAVVSIGEAKDLNSFGRRGGAIAKLAASPAAMDPNLKGTAMNVRVPLKLKSPPTQDGEMELGVDLLKKDDGSWDVLAYSFGGDNEQAVRALGKAAQSARRNKGGS